MSSHLHKLWLTFVYFSVMNHRLTEFSSGPRRKSQSSTIPTPKRPPLQPPIDWSANMSGKAKCSRSRKVKAKSTTAVADIRLIQQVRKSRQKVEIRNRLLKMIWTKIEVQQLQQQVWRESWVITKVMKAMNQNQELFSLKHRATRLIVEIKKPNWMRPKIKTIWLWLAHL